MGISGAEGISPCPNETTLSEILFRDVVATKVATFVETGEPNYRTWRRRNPAPPSARFGCREGRRTRVATVPELGKYSQRLPKGERAHGLGGVVPAFS